MNNRVLSTAAVLAIGITLSPLASAFSMNSLKQSAGQMMNGQSSSQSSNQAASGSASSLLGQMATGSMNLGSAQNAAGVLGYCEKQGYAQSATDKVKSQLLAKLGGQQEAEQSDSYQQGLNGLLKGGNGQTFSLGGLKDQVGQRVCSGIAKQAMSSFLGG